MIRDVDYSVRVLRNGAEVTRLSWADSSAPVVYVDKTGEIKGSFSGEFYENAAADLLADELQPVLKVNGEECPLGIFRAATITKKITQYGKMLRVEAYDRCWVLQSNRTQDVLHLSKGLRYTTAIEQILTKCGIMLFLVTPSTAVLNCDREDWEIGTDYLTICNELLSEINYNPVWFDADGMAHAEPYKEAGAENIQHHYGVADVLRPVSRDASEETDIFSAPNVFVCVCSNPDLDEALVATAENDSAVSATSTFRRGMKIVQITRVNNVASEAELQAMADRMAMESQYTAKTIGFETLAEGGHGVGDTISIDHEDIGGIYEETAWSVTLGAGKLMKHTAKRTVIA